MNVIKNSVLKFKKSTFYSVYLLPFYFFIVYSVFVRYQGLGYSNFQGDEINPLDYLGDIKGSNIPLAEFFQYLLNQKRGPMQYIINYINTGIFGYTDEYHVRLPFFFFGVLAFVTFFILARKIFNSKSAFWTVLILSMNGLYIAFARITQYQSFMYLTVPVSVFLYIYGFYKRKFYIIAISGLLLSMNLLGHYDTLSVGPFFAAFLISYLIKNIKDYKFVILSSLLFLVFFLVPALSFYVPFLTGEYYSESTSEYLGRRLEWSQFVPLTPLVIGLIKMYMPDFAWLSTFVAIALGIFFQFRNLTSIKLFKLKIPKNFIVLGYSLLSFLLTFSVIFSGFYVKPRLATLLTYGAGFSIVLILILSKKVKPEVAGVIFWFLFSMFFYFFFMKDPRTHVYVVFIPGFILAGYGLSSIIELLKSKSSAFFFTFYFLLISFLLYLSAFYWVVFVDKNPEYPWWDKKLFGKTVFEIGRVRHKKIDGVFGFNNYRHWEEIRNYYDMGCLVGTYNSNEKNSITSFYVGTNQTDFDQPHLVKNADTLVVVEGPHSWYYDGLDPEDIPRTYVLLKTLYNGDYPVTFIYGLNSVYPNAELLCLE